MLEGNRIFGEGPGGPGAAEHGHLGQEILEAGHARSLGDATDANPLLHVADPGKVGGIEPGGAIPKYRLGYDRVHERHADAAVLGRHVVEPVGRRDAARTDHVLHHHSGVARDVAAEVAREHARIDVEAGADLMADNDRERLAFIEVRDLLGRDAVGGGAGHDSDGSAQRFDTSRFFHFGCGTRMSSRSGSPVKGAVMNLNAMASATTSSTPETRSGSTAGSGRNSRSARLAVSSDNLAKAA